MQPSMVKFHRQRMYAGWRDCNLEGACLRSASCVHGLACQLHCPRWKGPLYLVFFCTKIAIAFPMESNLDLLEFVASKSESGWVCSRPRIRVSVHNHKCQIGQGLCPIDDVILLSWTDYWACFLPAYSWVQVFLNWWTGGRHEGSLAWGALLSEQIPNQQKLLCMHSSSGFPPIAPSGTYP